MGRTQIGDKRSALRLLPGKPERKITVRETKT
jgi:hypothetical protein